MSSDYWWRAGKYYQGKFDKPVTKQYKISIGTTCMDRLADLSTTLLFNIENEDYPNVEFVVLDYNSQKDNVQKWVRDNMMEYIEKGILNFYRTIEPQFYSMSHSRNLLYRLASGDIVMSVDADNFLRRLDLPRPEMSFASYINLLANQTEGTKGVFIKGHPLRGRQGYFKKDLLEELNGYDEEMENYGYEDIDLLKRAWQLDYIAFPFGGQYFSRIKTGNREKSINMKDKNWRKTEKENQEDSQKKLAAGLIKRNLRKLWGDSQLIKNFREDITVGREKKVKFI